jgi:hypothetical protein
MDARSEKLLIDKLDAINSKLKSKIKVSQKGRSLYSKKEKNYRMEQYNKLCKCLTTSKAQIVFKGVT